MKQLQHIGLTVSDLERSVDFYTTLLGQPATIRRLYREPYVGELFGFDGMEIDVAFFELPGVAAVLELVQFHDPPGRRVEMAAYNAGNMHLGLLVEDIDAAIVRLSEQGVAFRTPKAVAIPAGPYKGWRSVFLFDPDGVGVQLMGEPSDGKARNSETAMAAGAGVGRRAQ